MTVETVFFPLQFIAALLVGLLCIRTLRAPLPSRTRWLFAVFTGTIAILSVLAGLRFGYHLAFASFLQPFCATMVGPLSYLAFRSLTSLPRLSLVRTFVLHGTAPLLTAVLYMQRRYVGFLIDPVIIASFTVYALLLIRLRRQGSDFFLHIRLDEIAPMQRLLELIIALHLLSAFIDFAIFVDFMLAGAAHIRSILLFANIVLLMASALLLVARAHARIPIAETPAPPENVDRELAAKLMVLLEEQRLYLDAELTIVRLARRLGVPARQVSQAVNRLYQQNISQFINRYRVAEAQRLLRETNMPVTEIMLQSGFQTKSNFNREFLRTTHVNPSAYRTMHRSSTPRE